MKIPKIRNLLLLLAVLFTLVLVVTIVGRYQPDSTLQTISKSLPEDVALTLEEIDYTHVEQGIPRWRLQAKQVVHQTSSQKFLIRQPHLDLYDEKGEFEGTLDADIGEVSSDYKRLKVKGNVVLENFDGYTFYTEILSYDHDRQLAKTDSPVILKGEKIHLSGIGMEFNVMQRHITLFADVEAVFDPREISQD